MMNTLDDSTQSTRIFADATCSPALCIVVPVSPWGDCTNTERTDACEAFAEPPSCGFQERLDGSIVWGEAWSPGSCSGLELIAVEYCQSKSGAWVPFQAWIKGRTFVSCKNCGRTKDVLPDCSFCPACMIANAWEEHTPIHMYDCHWVESLGELYYNLAGSGEPYVNGWDGAVPPRGRIWIAAGTTVYSGDGEHRPLSDDDLLRMGIKRVHGPTPAALQEGIDGDTFYCPTCSGWAPEDDEGECCVCGEMNPDHPPL